MRPLRDICIVVGLHLKAQGNMSFRPTLFIKDLSTRFKECIRTKQTAKETKERKITFRSQAKAKKEV